MLSFNDINVLGSLIDTTFGRQSSQAGSIAIRTHLAGETLVITYHEVVNIAKDRDKTGGALTDAMIDEIAIIGDEDECRARIQADADGGVHTHIVAPMAASAADVQRTFAAFTADQFTLR